MSDTILLESPVFNLRAALLASEFGVDRLELCSSYLQGGCTPSPGLFRYVRKMIQIPIFVMIRPRGGNFVYSDDDLNVMKEEIKAFSEMNADGFVFGILNRDGSVNKKACEDLVTLCGEKPCTFHRAFDVSTDLYQSLNDIIECGFQRVLTSGGQKNVTEGLSVIKQLLEKAKDQIIIMPGGGVKPEHIQPLKRTGYLKEVHASCKRIEKDSTIHINPNIEFSGTLLKTGEYLSVDQKIIQNFKRYF